MGWEPPSWFRLSWGPSVWAEGLPLGLRASLLGWISCAGWEPTVWAEPLIWVEWFQPGPAEGPAIWAEESPAWVLALCLGGGPLTWTGGFLPGRGASLLGGRASNLGWVPPVWAGPFVWAEASRLGWGLLFALVASSQGARLSICRKSLLPGRRVSLGLSVWAIASHLSEASCLDLGPTVWAEVSYCHIGKSFWRPF